MGIAQSALILLGIGIVSSRFKAGVGLGELGTGIQTLVAAPLTGTGTGLSAFAGGLRDVFETFGDLGRGLSAIFEAIPTFPAGPPGAGGGAFPSPNGVVPPAFPGWPPQEDPEPGWGGGGGGVRALITKTTSDLDTGGGSRVPTVGISPAPSLFIQPVILPQTTTQPISVRPTNPNLVML